MVWIGLVRPMVGYLLLAPCGPVWSKLSASEITLPFFTSPAAAMMSCGLVKLSVPISSFGPHLPQFLYFSAASRRSWRVYFLAGMGLPSWVEPEAGGGGAAGGGLGLLRPPVRQDSTCACGGAKVLRSPPAAGPPIQRGPPCT